MLGHTQRAVNLNHIPQDSKEVAGGTGDGEEVPDEVGISRLGSKEYHAERVSNAARYHGYRSLTVTFKAFASTSNS